jgi:hypothetical protein
MDGPSQTVELHFAAATRRLVAWAARMFVRLVFAAALLLILIALLLGVTEVGRTGIVLLGTAAAIVVGHGLRLAWPTLVSASRRIRLRFSLRTLLAMTLVSGVGLAWLGNKLRDVREQRQIVRQISAGGFFVWFSDGYDSSAPQRYYDWFGISGAIATGTLEGARNNSTIRDEDLRALAGLRIRSLSLNVSNVTDDQINRCQLPAGLKCFAAAETGVGDRTVEHIASCQSLEAVELSGTKVTDAGVAHLVRLPNMYMLGLEKTPLTDDAVEHLKKMKQLHVLRIWQTSITPQKMEELRKALPDCLILDDWRQVTAENHLGWPQ